MFQAIMLLFGGRQNSFQKFLCSKMVQILKSGYLLFFLKNIWVQIFPPYYCIFHVSSKYYYYSNSSKVSKISKTEKQVIFGIFSKLYTGLKLLHGYLLQQVKTQINPT